MKKNLEIFLLLLVDFLAINISWAIYYFIRVDSGVIVYPVEPSFFLPGLIVYVYWFFIFLLVGMYRTWFAFSRFDEISTLFKASFVGIFILFFAIFMDDAASQDASATSRFLIFIYWGVFVILTSMGRISVRSFQKKLLVKGIGRRNVLMVGFNPRANRMHDTLIESRQLGLDVVAYVAAFPDNIGKEYKGVKVAGSADNIDQYIDQYEAREIVIALEQRHEDVIFNIIAKCDDKNVGIKIVADLYELISGQARAAQIYGYPLIDIMPQLMPEWEKKVKRLIDILASLIILVLSFPITLITYFVVRVDSPGPVFFRQERAGLKGKPFKMIKFRSMRQDAEKKTGPVWSQKNDPRITRVGKIIRKTRIDEIPQMINVLKGEMSLVGPRPERPFFVEKLAMEIPFYKKRLNVRPGVTGWAQVKHKYDETIEDVKAKLRYDLYYIENISLRLDFKIMFETVFVMLFGKGHYE